MSPIKPYANEADAVDIGELSIENRLDRISLYGALELTRDQAGLQQARQLKEILDAVVAALEAERNLPEKISIWPTDQVKNPFD